MELNVTVRKKVAMAERTPIIQDNGDYTVRFDWDGEWDGLNPVMLVVCPNGATYMQEISGNVAPLPSLRTDWVMIGLASEDIHTTTGAMFRCVRSVRSGSTTQVDPPEDVYAQLLAMYQSKVSEPAADGTEGQVLATDGKGGRYWKDGGGGTATVETDATPKEGSENPVQSGGVYDALEKKLDAENPVATGSLSLNRKADTTAGTYSVSQGRECEASGNNASIAEGYKTVASGGHGAHAEGYMTTAAGHTSHAEGYKTVAKANQTHAEGYFTIASAVPQHVEGEYNIEDPTPNTNGRGTYAHIIGNGKTESTRSNAHTLDWDGNAWFAGDVYVGSTSGKNRDEGSVKLAKEMSDTEAFTALVESGIITPAGNGKGGVYTNNGKILVI